MQEMHGLAREEQVAHLEGLARRVALDRRNGADEQEACRQHQPRGNEPCRRGEDPKHDHGHQHAREPEVPEITAFQVLRRPAAQIGVNAQQDGIDEQQLKQRHAARRTHRGTARGLAPAPTASASVIVNRGSSRCGQALLRRSPGGPYAADLMARSRHNSRKSNGRPGGTAIVTTMTLSQIDCSIQA